VNSGKKKAVDPRLADEQGVRALYQGILEQWNRRSARGFARCFAEDASVVGFDGSQMKGRAEIETVLGQIFIDHVTAAYVGIVREVRFLSDEVAVVRAVVGMVPPGLTDINPAVNAIQTLVASKRTGEWKADLFQNTPAAFHGRPELSDQLSAELRQVLRSSPAAKLK